jgi:hypothetical protein
MAELANALFTIELSTLPQPVREDIVSINSIAKAKTRVLQIKRFVFII